MAGIRFTEEQQQAIDTLDKSVLVAAAAGSGKTAVLVERIINIILKGHANVDEMLVVTFTNASAADMKLKLQKAIHKRMEEDPGSAEMLKDQLNRMYRAYISTFHSFALRLIREFFYKIDIEPSFGICDEVQGTLLQMEAMEEMFEDCFQEDDRIPGGSFRDFLNHYSSDRSEDALMQELLASYHKLRSIPKYFEWAESAAELLRLPEDGKEASPVYRELLEAADRELQEAEALSQEAAELLAGEGLDRLAAVIEEEHERIASLRISLSEGGDLEDLFARIGTFPFKTLRSNKAEKESYDAVKDDLKSLRDGYKGRIRNINLRYGEPDLGTRFLEMDRTYGYTRYYIALLQDFERRFMEKKKERNLLDFSDIEHICVEILEDPAVRETIRGRFRFIFIDEYQDTNKLQEYLIGRIARPDNVFKVGDVKQSIYSFRQSDPSIFMKTRREYDDPGNSDAMTIDLKKNFRSNGNTIRFINEVFEEIMPGYGEREMLYQGLPGDAVYDLLPEIHILLEDAESEGEGEDEEDEVLLTKTEAEAGYIAALAESIIGREFYDGKQGIRRRATPRDIAVLMRGTRRYADIYYKALMDRGIHAHVNDDEGYFDTLEVETAISLLAVIDNPRQDIALATVLRSPIFGFENVELAEIRAGFRESGGRGSYAEACGWYRENGTSETIRAGLDRVFSSLDRWRNEVRMMPLDEFVWHLLTESSYYLIAGALRGGRQRQANLRILIDRARSYQENGIASLSGFLQYIRILKDKGVRTGQAILVSEEDEVVRIMTIHKSKGLEFPFVILAGMGRKIRVEQMKKGFVIDADIGVSISYSDREQKFWRSTILQQLMHEKKKEEDFQEELRVLYVAMTRAREQLHLVGTMKEKELEETIPGRQTFYAVMRRLLNTESSVLHVRTAEGQRYFRAQRSVAAFLERRKNLDPAKAEPVYREIARRLDYTYPNEADLRTKAKFSVSELRSLAEDRSASLRQSFLMDPEFMDITKVTGAEIGTGYHRIMEKLDFARACKTTVPANPIKPPKSNESTASITGGSPGVTLSDDASPDAALSDSGSPDTALSDIGSPDTAYIRETAESLLRCGSIQENVYERLDLRKIEAFFESDIGRRAAEAARAGKLEKERPFTLQTEHDGHTVLVQGIIDCYFQEEDHLILVDYKSNYMKPGAEGEAEMLARYREQLRLYQAALEAGTGKKVAERYLYLFGPGKAVLDKAD